MIIRALKKTKYNNDICLKSDNLIGVITEPIKMEFTYYPDLDTMFRLGMCPKITNGNNQIGKFFWITKNFKKNITKGIIQDNMIKKYIAKKLEFYGYKCDYSFANSIFKLLKSLCEKALINNIQLTGRNSVNPYMITSFDEYFNTEETKSIGFELIEIFHEISKGTNFQYRYLTEND